MHLLKSNKWDAATDVLQVSKRIDILQIFERTPNFYVKRDISYRTKDIREKRAKRKRTSLMPNDEVPNQHANLSPQTLR